MVMGVMPFTDKVRTTYADLCRGNMQSINRLLTKDCICHLPGSNPLAGDYAPSEVIDYLGRLWQESGGSLRIAIHDVLANDDHVVILQLVTAETRGKRFESRGVLVGHLAEADDGKICEAWLFSERPDEPDQNWLLVPSYRFT